MKRKYLILFSLSGLILCLDQLTKHLVQDRLVEAVKHPVIPSVMNLVYSKNNGFAFGLLQKAPPSLQNIFFVGVPVFALILIILIFIKLQDNQMLSSIALTTILGGAIGNLIDRLHYGFVVDFVEFTPFGLSLPPFNVADASIVVGVVMMFVSTLISHKGQPATSANV